MNRRRNGWRIIALAIFFSAMGVILQFSFDDSAVVQRDDESVLEANQSQLKLQPQPKLTTTDDSSKFRLVNSEFPLAADYVPKDLVIPDVYTGNGPDTNLRKDAAAALRQMFTAAKEEAGFNLELASGYRTYETQAILYKSAGGDGQQLVSAPGTSEHQTGLAADIKRQDFVCRLETCFANQPEGEWTANNAHRFGYIVRYTEGKEDITGISFEPWHLRYVGEELAQIIYDKGLVLEEYHQITLQ